MLAAETLVRNVNVKRAAGESAILTYGRFDNRLGRTERVKDLLE
jgi:hypothetical protein